MPKKSTAGSAGLGGAGAGALPLCLAATEGGRNMGPPAGAPLELAPPCSSPAKRPSIPAPDAAADEAAGGLEVVDDDDEKAGL